MFTWSPICKYSLFKKFPYYCFYYYITVAIVEFSEAGIKQSCDICHEQVFDHLIFLVSSNFLRMIKFSSNIFFWILNFSHLSWTTHVTFFLYGEKRKPAVKEEKLHLIINYSHSIFWRNVAIILQTVRGVLMQKNWR